MPFYLPAGNILVSHFFTKASRQPTLKKRGLIERNGWQQFKLTPNALLF